MNFNFQTEPALVIAGVGALVEAALVLLIAFGLPITVDQKIAVTAFTTVVVTVLTGWVTRSQVTPVAGLPQPLIPPKPPTG